MVESASFDLLKHLPPSGTDPDGGDLLDRFVAWTTHKGLSLYPAQEEAILALYDGHNVILNTPTGSGKSLVATALHFHSIAHGRKSWYTCPIKALVNEKFLNLCSEFGPENVGMSTGDATINAGAPIICCTAEVLANLALRDGESAPVDDVIMDEFHYYSDRERGVSWQIPLIVLKRARFMLMSATLGDMNFFQREMEQKTGRPCSVIRSMERPVPLHFEYSENPLHEKINDLVKGNKTPVYLVNFTQRDCADEAQNLLSVDICTKEEKQAISATIQKTGIRFSSPYGKEFQKILRHGIGIHHAGLLPKYRLLVEKLAQKGLLKIISGTDTLGVGINIPIRTVLFTKLCKFDGEKTTLLSVRDFRQISGRAGRKGFDNEGLVVVQAPEHVIENKKIEAKAGGDPKKLRKLVKKSAPEKGFVPWNQETFDKLCRLDPEPLSSQFQVTHGMLLNVLSRPGDGCKDMKSLIRSCHDSAVSKSRHRRRAFQMFRALVDRKIVEFHAEDEQNGRKKIRVNLDLQEDFSLHHALSLWLIDTVKLVDPNNEDTWALDLLTLAEAIVEDPVQILRKQLDRIKRDKVAEMKMEGIEYEDRMIELEKLEHPKPNREFIYQTFNEFAASHPWVGNDNIRPKSIAREMFEGFMTFGEYVRAYDLQRSEGLLLRYLTEVYKVLMQTLPATAKDDLMNEIIEWLGVVTRQTDSTLLDEWERLKSPGAVVAKSPEVDVTEEFDITRSPRAFQVAIRNEAFQFVRALADGRLKELSEMCRECDAQTPWTADALADRYNQYRSAHSGPLLDRRGRATSLTQLAGSDGDDRIFTQVLADEDAHNDWQMTFSISIPASRAAGKPVLKLVGFSEIGATS